MYNCSSRLSVELPVLDVCSVCKYMSLLHCITCRHVTPMASQLGDDRRWFLSERTSRHTQTCLSNTGLPWKQPSSNVAQGSVQRDNGEAQIAMAAWEFLTRILCLHSCKNPYSDCMAVTVQYIHSSASQGTYLCWWFSVLYSNSDVSAKCFFYRSGTNRAERGLDMVFKEPWEDLSYQ